MLLLLFYIATSCLLPHKTAGCNDHAIEVCTCLYDPYCCQAMWDQSCVDTAKEFGCIPDININKPQTQMEAIATKEENKASHVNVI